MERFYVIKREVQKIKRGKDRKLKFSIRRFVLRTKSSDFERSMVIFMKLTIKKKLPAVLSAVAITGLLAACGKSPEEMKYLSDIKAKDYVILGNYDELEVEVAEPEVTDEYLEGYLTYIMMNSATYEPVTGRSVQSGDVVNIDFEGKMDGVAFAGGTAEGYELTIGSGQFIPGFEDGVIGMEIGETKDLDLNFPDPYSGNPDLSGKPVVFTVTLNSISEAKPAELTDEYVAGLNIDGCSTVEDYRNYLYEGLMEQAEAAYEEQKMDAALAAMEESSVFEEPPVGMVNRLNDMLVSNAEAYAGLSNLEIGDYVSRAYGGSAEDYEETLLEQAKEMANSYIMVAAIADKEKITVTDEELSESLSGRSGVDEEAYREYLLLMKVGEFLADNAAMNSPDSE